MDELYINYKILLNIYMGWNIVAHYFLNKKSFETRF